MQRVMQRLFEPVDLASLAVFRFAFGTLMVAEVARYFVHDWVRRYYIAPSFHFTYPGFSWVTPWPGTGMYWHFAILGIAAACVAFGFAYRFAAALFAVGISYVFLLDETNYLNHLYLICLLSFLMVCIPGGRLWAMDARLGWSKASDTGPRWTLLLIQAQLALVYFFGGIAKLEPDWLSGAPGASFLAGWEVTEPLARYGWFAQLFAFAGAGFDLFIAPALIWRRTRVPATVAAVLFHCTNMQMFQIGIFPWLMLAATPIFYSPSWPRRVKARFESAWTGVKVKAVTVATASSAALQTGWRERLVVGALGVWFAVQVAMPLRHWFYPGDVNWTEQGHNFSWHMKLRNKDGDLRLFIVSGGEGIELDLRDYLTKRQIQKMSTRPHMVEQFAQHVGRKVSADLGHPVQVRVYNSVSLNGRPPAFLIDPTADLLTTPPSLYLLGRSEEPPRFSASSDE